MRFNMLGASFLPLALLAGCGSGTSSSQDTGSPDQATPASATDTGATDTETPNDTATPVAATQTANAGAAPVGFAVCRSCHSVKPGVNAVGPSLAGIYGSKAGAVPGYPFSPALARSGIVWDEASLDTWLKGPMRMVPGTRMAISVSDPARRKAIIEYLKTLK